MKKFVCFLLLPLLFSLSACQRGAYDLKIDFIDVGKADCIVLRTPKETVMIDTGEEENVPEILVFLAANQIECIDHLILTHFDKDHIGGAAKILESLTVRTLYQSAFSTDREEYDEYTSVLSEQKKKPRVLTEAIEIALAGAVMTIHPPLKDNYDKNEDNNASLIVDLDCGDTSVLFCGDAMEERLSEWMNISTKKFDLIKLPYHGNMLDNYRDFLKHTKPKTAVICDSNKYPADPKLIGLLEESKIDFFETKNGTVSFALQENKWIRL